MTDRAYLFRMADGEICIGYRPRGSRKLPDDAIRWLPRAPGPGEFWDIAQGEYRHNARAEINRAADAKHRAAVHAVKTVEALLVLAGFEHPDMMIVPEAELRGITPVELARIVRAKFEPAAQLELKRQAMDLAASQKEDFDG